MHQGVEIQNMYSYQYHIAMKYVAPIRKELGIRTIFNILGPLANPAGATMQVMGVYDESLVEPLAQVLSNLGVKKGMVVYGMDKLDEISVSSATKVSEIKNNKIDTYTIEPEDFNITRCKKEDLTGGDADFNAKITENILNGQKGSKRDAVLLNSAAGLYVADKVKSLNDGVELAENIIDNGKAKIQLNNFIELSNNI